MVIPSSASQFDQASALLAQLKELDLHLLDAPMPDPALLLDRRASLLGQLSLLTRDNPAAMLGHLGTLIEISENTRTLTSSLRAARQNLVNEMQAAEQKLRHLQSLLDPAQPLIDRLG